MTMVPVLSDQQRNLSTVGTQDDQQSILLVKNTEVVFTQSIPLATNYTSRGSFSLSLQGFPREGDLGYTSLPI